MGINKAKQDETEPRIKFGTTKLEEYEIIG